MKKVFRLTDLDCANCAAKMENGIKKIDGVTSASVNFMSRRLTVEADEERFPSIMEEARRLVKKIEPDCELV